METLFKMAKEAFGKVEIFSTESSGKEVVFRNGKLHDMESRSSSGLSLRAIKDGRLGFGYTTNIIDRKELLANVRESMQEGLNADFSFPATDGLKHPAVFDPAVDQLTSGRLLEECARISARIHAATDSETYVVCSTGMQSIRVRNDMGTDLATRSSEFGLHLGLIFPGGAAGIDRCVRAHTFESVPESFVDETASTYKLAVKVVAPPAGRMKVLFMPDTLYVLTWRLASGTNAKSVYEKVSPLKDKVNDRILDEKLSIWDDASDERRPGARAFDDEGVPCTRLPLVENGVLKGFFSDLKYAAKLKTESTGNGYRRAAWDSNTIALKPEPDLANLCIAPGTVSLKAMIASMDRGIVLEGAMGAHSGNIPNGDYSVGVAPALYVENGEIVGRIKDAMVAGNIYDTLKNVAAIEDRQHVTWQGMMPAVLCDDVSVSIKR